MPDATGLDARQLQILDTIAPLGLPFTADLERVERVRAETWAECVRTVEAHGPVVGLDALRRECHPDAFRQRAAEYDGALRRAHGIEAALAEADRIAAEGGHTHEANLDALTHEIKAGKSYVHQARATDEAAFVASVRRRFVAAADLQPGFWRAAPLEEATVEPEALLESLQDRLVTPKPRGRGYHHKRENGPVVAAMKRAAEAALGTTGKPVIEEVQRRYLEETGVAIPRDAVFRLASECSPVN